jgi:iron complex outermembrane receptor protein
VTAQKRTQNLRDVPLTVNVVSGADANRLGITSVKDLGALVAGYNPGSQNSVAAPSIRGVSTLIATAGSEPPNALYVDGVYNALPAVLNISLPDLQSVEVLKGPQGTLFGRNATGGAVLVHTKQPEFTTHGDFGVEAGEYLGSGGSKAAAHVNARAFLTGPIVDDVLAASIAVGKDYTPGYWHNDVTGGHAGKKNQTYVRGKLLFTPGTHFRVTLTGYYIHWNAPGVDTTSTYKGLSAAAQYAGSVVPTKPWHTASDAGAGTALFKEYGTNLRAEYQFGLGTLTSITSYDKLRDNALGSIHSARGPAGCLFNFACIDYRLNIMLRQVSQEFTFTSKRIGPIEFTSGLFYYNAKGTNVATIQETVIPGGITIQNAAISTKALAGYTEATLTPTRGLHFVAGIRYNHEKHDDIPFPGLPDIRKTFNAWTPRLSVRYEATPYLSLYAVYSKGYKSGLTGATNASSTPAFAPVKPETLTAYEVGAKFRRGPLALNTAFFYYDYKNKQEQFFSTAGPIAANVGPVRIYGLDVDGSAKISRDLKISASFSWIPVAKYLDFKNAAGTSTIVIPFGPGGSCAPGGGCGGYFPGHGDVVSTTFDATGLRLIRTPRISANVLLNYTHATKLGELEGSLLFSYRSKAYHDVSDFVVQPAYLTINAEVAMRLSNGLRVGLYGRNLTNKAYITGAVTSGAGFTVNYGAPRELGITASYTF